MLKGIPGLGVSAAAKVPEEQGGGRKGLMGLGGGPRKTGTQTPVRESWAWTGWHPSQPGRVSSWLL